MRARPREDAPLRRVWIAFADQFLDSETRPDIPFAALAAVEAELTVAEAKDVWRRDVAPVVGPNLLCITGEWGAWDEAWLVARIREVRRQPGLVGWLWRLAPAFDGRSWRAIAGCMRALLSFERDRRAAIARDLHALGCRYFGVSGPALDPARRDELRRLYHEVFAPIFAGVVYPTAGESRRELEARVEAALGTDPEEAAQ